MVTFGKDTMNIETGYFFITDITGYTQFLAHSELDHAKEILDALFESILDNIEPPLVVSNTQGDAIICYAPAQAFHQPRQLLDVMERTYFDFRRLLKLMNLNSNCDCNACINMSALDLKIFLHYGQYIVQQIGTGTDLQGTDVILAHRLMKNTVLDKFKLQGYGLITEAALKAMEIDPAAEGMQEHVEEYEHYGAVKVYVHDVRAAWRLEHERQRSIVTAEDAVAHAGVFVPIPPWIAWDYAANMELKKIYFDLESIERTDVEGGREKIGISFHCRHRLGDIHYLYVDFDPPNYVTFESRALGFTSLNTLRIVPAEGGSRFEIYNGRPYEEGGDDRFTLQQELAESAVARFAKVIADETEAGRIDPGQSEASATMKSNFGRPDVAKGRFGDISIKDPS
jgi:hypothetical protein